MEIVHQGMLKKSPPQKKLWRGKWRMRWFVLRSGELPGQYFLEYYTDQTRRKLKGKIDLDQCDQVDAGITFANRKLEDKFMFDIKTPKRVYYLCAETEQEMNRWVDCVCQVCGLKIYSQEDEYPPLPLDHLSPTPSATPPTPLHSLPHDHLLDSPSLSPSSPGSSISGPYIPISTCFTGRRTTSAASSFPFGDDIVPFRMDNHRSSIPTELAPPLPVLDSHPPLIHGQSPQSPPLTMPMGRDGYDPHNRQEGIGVGVAGCKSPLGQDACGAFAEDHWDVTGGVAAIGGILNDIRCVSLDEEVPAAPPRPPKPPHLIESHQVYQNFEAVTRRRSSAHEHSPAAVTTTPITPTAPPPSSPHEMTTDGNTHTHTNARTQESMSPPHVDRHRPRQQTHTHTSLTPKHTQVFSYDLRQQQQQQDRPPDQGGGGETDPRISPGSTTTTTYSNITQHTNNNNNSSSSNNNNNNNNNTPPAVDRGLKPRKTSESSSTLGSCDLASPTGLPDTPHGAVGGGGGSPAPPSSAPPIVHRNLKPMKAHQQQQQQQQAEPMVTKFVLDPAPTRLMKHSSSSSRTRAAPSPTPPTAAAAAAHNGRGGGGGSSNNNNGDSGEEGEAMSSTDSRRNSSNAEQFLHPCQDQELQYLRLDHEPRSSPQTPKSAVIKSKMTPMPTSTVYKEIDFVKTDAFNKIRESVDDTYRKNQ